MLAHILGFIPEVKQQSCKNQWIAHALASYIVRGYSIDIFEADEVVRIRESEQWNVFVCVSEIYICE